MDASPRAERKEYPACWGQGWIRSGVLKDEEELLNRQCG